MNAPLKAYTHVYMYNLQRAHTCNPLVHIYPVN